MLDESSQETDEDYILVSPFYYNNGYCNAHVTCHMYHAHVPHYGTCIMQRYIYINCY